MISYDLIQEKFYHADRFGPLEARIRIALYRKLSSVRISIFGELFQKQYSELHRAFYFHNTSGELVLISFEGR